MVLIETILMHSYLQKFSLQGNQEKNNEHLKMAFRKNFNFTGGEIKFSGLIKSKKIFKCCVSYKMSLLSFVSRRFRPLRIDLYQQLFVFFFKLRKNFEKKKSKKKIFSKFKFYFKYPVSQKKLYRLLFLGVLDHFESICISNFFFLKT